MSPLMSSRATGAHSLSPVLPPRKPGAFHMVVFYKDLNKVARADHKQDLVAVVGGHKVLAKYILMDDYSLKRTLKMKHTTPHGLSVTSKSEHNKGVAAALEAKYFHTPSGVMIDKAKLNTDGSMGVEASMKGVAKDVKILAKVNDVLKGDVSVEVTKPKMSTSATVDVEGTWVKASSCVAVGNSLLVGGDVESTLGGEKQPSLKAYSVGAATGGARWGASVTCTNKLQTYNASGYYIVQPDLIASVLASTTPEKSEHSFQGGVKYKFKPDTTVRAKVNSKGVAAACVVQQCASKLSVTVTGQVSKADTNPKFGVSCALG